MEGMLGEIRLFAGNFAPRGWALCQGQLLPISQNTALFSILGTIYGGDGRTTFALPDLRGRVPVGPGNGPGLSSYREGQRGGVESVTLNTTQIPSHNHTVQANSGGGSDASPVGGFSAEAGEDIYNGTADAQMGATTNTGGGQSHENRQPYLAVNYIICMQGVFPSRS